MPQIPPSPKKRRAWRIWLPLLLILGLIGWPFLTLHWAYSEGDRVGVLQKLSTKGWLCKTNEGELAQYLVSGMAPQIWAFTVRDDQVYKQLNQLVGQRVRLHYEEHRGVPSSCFGDTRYFVDQGTPTPH